MGSNRDNHDLYLSDLDTSGIGVAYGGRSSTTDALYSVEASHSKPC
jgi:hypothetical protein